MILEEFNIIKEQEGDNFFFNHLGCFCYGLRGPIGTWCGYVCIDKKFLNINIDIFGSFSVHGGITFETKVNKPHLDLIKKVLNENSINLKIGDYVIGFDTAHHGDFIPGIDLTNKFRLSLNSTNPIYRDKEYVMEECKDLALQVNKKFDGANYVHKIFKKLNK